MRRSVTLISVGITAFSIVILATVVYGLRAAASPRVASSAMTTALLEPAPQISPELESASAVPSPRISPQAAVTLASDLIKRTDAVSVQMTDYNGQAAYKVVFASGDAVYVSLGGQVLGTVPAGVQMANSGPDRKEWNSEGGGGGGGHESDDDEHDDEHEDEAGD